MKFNITSENKKRQFKIHFQKARENLEEAKILMKEKHFRGAVSRAYYSIFEAARATLVTKGIAAKTHSGLISLFSLHFIKTKEIPAKFGEILKNAKEFREAADYGMVIEFDKKDAERIVKSAEEFIKMVEEKFKMKI